MLLFLLLGFTFFKHYDFIMMKCHFRPGVKESGSVPRETRPLRGGCQADPQPPLHVQSPILSVCAGHRESMAPEWWTHQHISLRLLVQERVMRGNLMV